MENQRNFFALFGRKKKVLIISIAVLLLVGVLFRGFIFGSHIVSRGFFSTGIIGTGNVSLATKDFESVGIVFAEVSTATRDGYRKTYNALIQEAAEKGADAIINVNISSKREFLSKSRTWNGSALAIKYRDAVPEGISVETANSALFIHSGRNRF